MQKRFDITVAIVICIATGACLCAYITREYFCCLLTMSIGSTVW